MKSTLIILFTCFFLINHCNKKTSHGNVKINVQYSKDSTYLAEIINNWMQHEDIKYFEHSRFFALDKAKAVIPEVYLDTILYNENQTKMFSIIIIKSDINLLSKMNKAEYYNEYKGQFLWDARSIVGFRNSTNDKWSVFPWMPLIQTGFTSSEKLRKETRFFYFNEVRNRSAYAYQEGDSLVMLKYDYNVNDSDFWDKCFLWRKGLAKKGYYNFQLQGLVKNKEPEVIDLNK